MTSITCKAGHVIIRRHELIQTITEITSLELDSDTVLVPVSDITSLISANHVTIRASDPSFADLLSLLDSHTLACLLSGSVITPDTFLVVPWNGAAEGRLQIVTVDSDHSFSNPKRIDLCTKFEVITSIPKYERRCQLADPCSWYDAVVSDYPGQTIALRQLIDIIDRQYDLGVSVGVIISGSDPDSFVDIVTRHSHLPAHNISIADLFSPIPGQAEQRLHRVFSSAYENNAVIIIVRDLHLLQNSNQGQRLRFHLEQLLDELQLQRDIMAIVLAPIQGSAADLPASLRRSLRLDHLVVLGSLDQADRSAILSSFIGDGMNLLSISEQTHGFTRPDLQRLSTESILNAIGRGDTQLQIQDLYTALHHVRPSSLDERFCPSRLSISLSSLAGIDTIVARVRSAIMTPLSNPESYQRLGIRAPRGVLIYGPSGVGKTSLALGVAAEAHAVVLEACGCDLISAVVGESEKAIRELFERARALAPSIIVLDQVEILAPRRDRDQSQTYDRVLSCLLTELDGITSRSDQAPVVFVIGTTSFRDRMDDAILRPGRFDEQIEVNLPDLDGRRAILKACCSNIPIADDVDLDEMAIMTSGYSGADLHGLCIEAAMQALSRDLHTALITAHDFRSVTPLIANK